MKKGVFFDNIVK